MSAYYNFVHIFINHIYVKLAFKLIKSRDDTASLHFLESQPISPEPLYNLGYDLGICITFTYSDGIPYKHVFNMHPNIN